MDYIVRIVQQQSIIIDLKLISQTFLTICDSNIRLLFVHKDIHLLGFHIEILFNNIIYKKYHIIFWNIVEAHFDEFSQ